MHTRETIAVPPARHERWGAPTWVGQPAVPRCRCRRVVPADMLLDVRALDAELRQAWRIGPGPALCDGCRDRVVRLERRAHPHDFYRALGAPPRWLEYILAKARWRGHMDATAPDRGVFAEHPLSSLLVGRWAQYDHDLRGLSAQAIAARHNVRLAPPGAPL